MGSSQYVLGLGLILPECPRPKPADEIKPAEPLNYFIAQASATIEAGAPTLARKEHSPIKHGLSAAAWASIMPLGSGS
jgi:hypothetical protein